jgi:predicted lipoprotein with Yx(FWY)xxD motif
MYRSHIDSQERSMSIAAPSALTRLGVVLAFAAVLAACTSSTETSPAGAASEAASEAAAPAEESAAASEAAGGGDATVEVADGGDLGEILVDADGNTIYFFANDEEGVSNCEGDCLANWPPVPADQEPVAGDGVTAELGTIEGNEGGEQLTVNGFPAYLFAGDEAPGDTNGQGVGGVWWVFAPDGEPIEEE